jgi:hypothetical protein
MEAKPGDRVVFPAALLDVSQGKATAHVLGDDEALIRETDILLVLEQGAEVDIEL